MSNQINEKYMVSHYFVIFLLYVSMIGVGVTTFQKKLSEHAGYNAWISVLLTGISIHIILWMIYKILSSNGDGQDVTTINITIFGKILGNFLNSAVVLYFVFGALIKFIVYNEVIQVWLFPGMNFLPVSIVMALIIYYAVSGGFRSVTGTCVWAAFFSITSFIPQILLVFPYLHPLNLLPLLNHSATDILLSSKTMVFEYLGFETLLLFYPFIKTQAKSQKWAQILMICVTLIYLIILIFSFMFFSEGQLQHSIWPTLDMVNMYEVPLFQRLASFFISLWFIKVIAGITVYLWVACRGIKTAFRIRPRNSLIVVLIALVALNYFITGHRRIEWITGLYSNIGFYFIYSYIPFIFVSVLVRKKLMCYIHGGKPA
ncbi:GerAB/ArcD/ProY family transporter [Paenibacillus filicis]|uniref:GerAB/ArcD/ProY family transporter n=1 Tax=Paenibacillus gyeongsangnamensis TaxID=3388067 RepID=A0ABT4QEY1_9BACL|nr:GerAB/ArcD/ProY family transporter [Paenibacillus filicis]MCZ8515445.1 GerAB/ArcD/ProY family transporter [Paenibacillus filicis]